MFYYKGLMQIQNKFTGEHPRGNTTLEIHKGTLHFHPYTTSSMKSLTVLRKSIHINEQAELNIAKENYGIKKRN